MLLIMPAESNSLVDNPYQQEIPRRIDGIVEVMHRMILSIEKNAMHIHAYPVTSDCFWLAA